MTRDDGMFEVPEGQKPAEEQIRSAFHWEAIRVTASAVLLLAAAVLIFAAAVDVFGWLRGGALCVGFLLILVVLATRS